MVLMPADDLFALCFDLCVGGEDSIRFEFLIKKQLGAKLIFNRLQFLRRQVCHSLPPSRLSSRRMAEGRRFVDMPDDLYG